MEKYKENIRIVGTCEKKKWKGMLKTRFSQYTILSSRKPNWETYVDKTERHSGSYF